MRKILLTLSLLGSLCSAGCGGGGGGSSTLQVSPTITSVSASCTPASIQTGQTSQCSATVSGTGSYSSAVTWAATDGAITSSGVFTPSGTGAATITATSTQDTTKSGNATVTVTAPNNPVPTITSLLPTSATAGAAAQTLTINGTNFLSGSTVTYNGAAHSATLVSSAQLTISLTASDQAAAGTFPVVASNPSPCGGASNSVNFTVNNPAPSVSSASPKTLPVGSPTSLVTVAGTNFVASSQIVFNGTSAPTTFVSPTELTATLPASLLVSAASVSVAVSNTPPGGGTSSTVAIQVVSLGSLTMLAVPATATDPTGPWSAFVVARDPSGNPIAGLPITMTASQGTLSVSSGTTDANGSFSTTITPPAGISATEAVGLVATSGGQAVSASLLFTGVSTAAARTGNSAAALRRKLGVEAATPAASSAATIPVAIGISIASPGSTSPFATPNYCYTTAALSSTETSQCAALYQEQSIALQPTNPFQAACNVANVADTAVDVGECVGTAVTVVSCAVSASGVGSVATLGAADAVCAATVDLTASTLAPDCAEFIINEVTNYFSPKAATAEEVVELTVEPSENPLDYAVALCDLASSSGSQSSGAVVAPVAGNGVQGNSNGLALSISLNSPTGIAIDASGNVYFDDDGNNVIRELNIATNEVTTVVGTGATGYTGDNGPAASATLNHPTQLAFDADYNLYIADADNNVVRKVSGGIITTVAGTGIAGYSGDGSAAVHAMLDYPDSIFLDAAGNLYISDASNNRIRKVTSNGVINTVAGNGIGSYGGDNGPALDAELNGPTRVVVDSVGNLYISDLHNNRIRKVNGSNEIISTIAGNGISGDEGDGGAATSAELNEPVSLALDTSGNVYIADLGNQRIRVVNTQTAAATLLGVAVQPGTIATVVGGGAQSDLYAGAVLSVSLLYPTGLLTDKTGNLYFADADNNIILRAGGGN